MIHSTMIECWASDLSRVLRDGQKPCVGLRWVCSCGRLGPHTPIAGNEAKARKTAERGGKAHERRWTPHR